MKIENLCINCMKEKASPEGRCEHCGYDPAEDTIPPHHLSPFIILEGKYLVGKSIGEGGFGITYIGMDLNLEMRVAIKEYYPNGCATRDTSGNSCTVQSYSGEAQTFFETGREKFINEAKILAKCIDLPEIVTVKDFFKENHTAYIVMEFLEGQTLKAYLKERGGRISATETLNMMKPLIRSLGQVHKMNLIHRDISPDNIMITTNYEVKILDFGGARDFGSARGRSMSIMLKPGYAPEEQYRTHGEQGPWTDVYALCATMYRCITGQIPPESMERTYQDHLRPVTDFQPDCPQEVNFAICKGLNVYKDDRWQSMEELYDCLYNGRANVQQEVIQDSDNHNGHNNHNNSNNRVVREEGQVRGRQYYPKKQNNMLPVMAGILGVVLIVLLAVFGVNYYKAKMDSDSSSGPVETTAEADKTDTESVDEGTTDKSKDSDQKTNSETKEKSEEEPEVTSTSTPVPTLTETPKVAYIDMEHIQNEIFRAKGSGAQESLYLRDCIGDASRGTGEKNTAMPATGMVSVPILYTLAVKMDDPNSGITLNTPVTFQYTYDTYSGGRGHLTSAQSGQQMSIDTLVQEMLMYSDNNATNSLISFLTLEGIQQICQENDFTSVVMRRQIVKGGTSADDNLISAKDATNMVYELFMNEFSVINRDYLMNYMRICDNAQRHAIFQSDTLYNGGTFCNQNGIRPNPGSGTYAEVGIILADGQQYIVCVMSDGGDADLASNEFSDAVNYIHTCMLETH